MCFILLWHHVVWYMKLQIYWFLHSPVHVWYWCPEAWYSDPGLCSAVADNSRRTSGNFWPQSPWNVLPLQMKLPHAWRFKHSRPWSESLIMWFLMFQRSKAWPWRWRHHAPSKHPETKHPMTQHHSLDYLHLQQHWCQTLKSHISHWQVTLHTAHPPTTRLHGA